MCCQDSRSDYPCDREHVIRSVALLSCRIAHEARGREVTLVNRNSIWDQIPKVRTGLLLGSMLFALYAALRLGTAEGFINQYAVYPGIQETGSFTEYGWHFNENLLGYWFGARDFNHPNDGNSINVWIEAEVMTDQAYPTRYVFEESESGCTATAKAQIGIFGTWYLYGGSDVRYLHIKNAFDGATGVMQYTATNKRIHSNIGQVASSSDPTCLFGSPHLHQSAYFDPTLSDNVRNTFSTDTCWITTEDDDQCPDDNYDRHDNCPSGHTSGNFSVTGDATSAEYGCASWSATSHYDKTVPFLIVDW